MACTLRILLAALLCLRGGLPAAAGEIDDQRALFMNAYAAAESGRWILTDREERLLKRYVLWPDLRGEYLEHRLRGAESDEIRAFLNEFGSSSAAKSLRYRWAKDLVRQGQWPEYLGIYDAHYATLGDTELDCLALTAQIRSNRTVNGVLALKLWRVGKSQPEECDPVFAWLGKQRMLDTGLVRERFELALGSRQFDLAAYLARRLGESERRLAADWRAMRDRAADQLIRYRSFEDTSLARKQLAYGIGRLARRDTAYADVLWREIRPHFDFDAESAARVSEEIALIAAWRHEAGAARLIASVEPSLRSNELLGWQLRTALRDSDWQQVLAAFALMSPDEASLDAWQYWRARALLETGSEAAGRDILSELAGRRSFYGFVAADLVDAPYAFSDTPLAPDTGTMERLGALPALLRARELFATGLTARARSEWDASVAALNESDKAQAALLAQQWGWHSRAISTAASGGYFDDLALRYPLPWTDWFSSSSAQANIEPAWAYGIARSESLFMSDVRSRAGAVGLMQLMPATGRQTAKMAAMSYRGISTLTDPRSNIILGTRYLGSMYERFGNNKVLATAAYNAGPHRVDRWLPRGDTIAADVWIETIPYDETRKYVQRVLEAATVFHWRMTQSTRRVSSTLKPIAGPVQQAALERRASKPGS